jgi:hypothetical protein
MFEFILHPFICTDQDSLLWLSEMYPCAPYFICFNLVLIHYLVFIHLATLDLANYACIFSFMLSHLSLISVDIYPQR